MVTRRCVARLLLISAFLTIGCDRQTGPGTTTSLSIQPEIPDVSAFSGLSSIVFDRVQVIVTLANNDVAVDTVILFHPDSNSVRLRVRVPLRSDADTVQVQVALLAGGIPLFAGQRVAQVSLATTAGNIIQVPLTYVGPGSQVATVTIVPLDSVLSLGDSIYMQAIGLDGAGGPVPQFYVSWSTDNPALATVNGAGLLRAPAIRGVVLITARTPNGVSTATPMTFSPPPIAIVKVAGDGQAVGPGAPLPIPFVVQVNAADGQGVKGVPVQFRSLDPQAAVVDPVVVTDASGQAMTTARLGTTLGPYSFEASVPGLGTVTFSAVAN